MNIVATIEVRMGSSRLPGKALLDVAGKPLLERVIDRIRLSRHITDAVVATSVNPLDDVLEAFCQNLSVPCFRGSEDDVLLRVVGAAESRNADLTVQFGGDLPFIDWQLVDELIEAYLVDPGVDLVTNCLELTYPLGVYTYVVPMHAMRTIEKLASKPPEREDVTRYLWEHPDRFKLVNHKAPPELHRPDLRLTVDYPEDLELTRRLYSQLLPARPRFTTGDILELIDRDPNLAAINQGCVQRSAPHLTLQVDR